MNDFNGTIPVSSYESKPLVSIVMESQYHWNVMCHAVEMLDFLGVNYETFVIGSNGGAGEIKNYVRKAVKRGIKVFIVCMVAKSDTLRLVAKRSGKPAIGVPILPRGKQEKESIDTFQLLDSSSGSNAALMAVNHLGKDHPKLKYKIEQHYGILGNQVNGILDVNLC